MAKVPAKFLDVDVAQLPYGDAGATLADVLDSIAGSDVLIGMWLSYASARTITVQPGRVGIAGAPYVLPSPAVVDIYNDFGDAGSPVGNTIYYLYAADDTDGLNFYFSAASPRAPGVADTSLQPVHRTVPLYHPAHADWRYIGQVLFRTGSTILPFTTCTPTYWEGAWTSATRNVDMTLQHGWGAIPQDTHFTFSTTATNSDNVLTTLAYATPSSKLYGLLPRAVSNKTIDLDIQKDALFWNNNTAAWANSGYLKVTVTR